MRRPRRRPSRAELSAGSASGSSSSERRWRRFALTFAPSLALALALPCFFYAVRWRRLRRRSSASPSTLPGSSCRARACSSDSGGARASERASDTLARSQPPARAFASSLAARKPRRGDSVARATVPERAQTDAHGGHRRAFARTHRQTGAVRPTGGRRAAVRQAGAFLGRERDTKRERRLSESEQASERGKARGHKCTRTHNQPSGETRRQRERE